MVDKNGAPLQIIPLLRGPDDAARYIAYVQWQQERMLESVRVPPEYFGVRDESEARVAGEE